MANWVVTCKNCRKAFTFASISDSLSDFYFPHKPDFPPEGLERECTHCSSKFKYQAHELSYRDYAARLSRQNEKWQHER